MVFDWTTVSSDPISREANAAVRAELNRRRRARCLEKDALVREFVAGRTVLDIGVVEHSMNHVESEGWLHGKIKGWGRQVLGVDLLEPEVAKLRDRGFDVLAVDATGEADIGRRFERVVIGDVLEHVDNPVNLLRFAGRHLAPEGRILATTPNPLYIANLLECARLGVFVGNVDHVTWITPAYALELGRRAGLELLEYRLIQLAGHGGSLKLKTLHLLRDRLFPEQEFFGYAFGYIYGRPD